MSRTLTTRRVGAIAIALIATLLLGGCFRLIERKTYAIGFEASRANLVVHTTPTRALQQVGVHAGSSAARQLVLAGTPAALPISTHQRLALCALSAVLCLTAPQIGRLLAGWFRADVTTRGDFWEALSYAGRHHRCFAWTAVPRRNLTHKGQGTSGCAIGSLP